MNNKTVDKIILYEMIVLTILNYMGLIFSYIYSYHELNPIYHFNLYLFFVVKTLAPPILIYIYINYKEAKLVRCAFLVINPFICAWYIMLLFYNLIIIY